MSWHHNTWLMWTGLFILIDRTTIHWLFPGSRLTTRRVILNWKNIFMQSRARYKKAGSFDPAYQGKLITMRAFRLAVAVLFSCVFTAGAATACDAVESGCLGCSDATLAACINELVTEICSTGRPDEFCDRESATDDVEELILKSLGRHMSRVRALVRSGSRYKHSRPHYR